MNLTNAQIIMATAQAFDECKIQLHEVWCGRGLKAVYTWIDDYGADQTGFFIFNRNSSYEEMKNAIKENITEKINQ